LHRSCLANLVVVIVRIVCPAAVARIFIIISRCYCPSTISIPVTSYSSSFPHISTIFRSRKSSGGFVELGYRLDDVAVRSAAARRRNEGSQTPGFQQLRRRVGISHVIRMQIIYNVALHKNQLSLTNPRDAPHHGERAANK